MESLIKVKEKQYYLPFSYNFCKKETFQYKGRPIEFITGLAWARYGLKPQPNALIKYLEYKSVNKINVGTTSKPFKILVGGNSVGSDVQLGINLEDYCKKQGLNEKVRVDTFFYSREEKKIKVNINDHNHYNINSLEELSGLIEKNEYAIDFVDFDGTLADCCLGRGTKVKLKSRLALPKSESESLNKLSRFLAFGVRMTYAGTMYLGDVFYSCLKLKPRFEWPEKENSLKDFLESVTKLPTKLVISRFSCLGGVLNAISESKANVNLKRPIYY
ncbi:MAG: hypothetical protein PHN56_00520 [Candidatus Nanoarchaeia archaeon]|nr:hypothetical protein [Candidatus Nanoarchaeia archaeon]